MCIFRATTVYPLPPYRSASSHVWLPHVSAWLPHVSSLSPLCKSHVPTPPHPHPAKQSQLPLLDSDSSHLWSWTHRTQRAMAGAAACSSEGSSLSLLAKVCPVWVLGCLTCRVKSCGSRDFLVIQCYDSALPMQGALGSIHGQGTRSHTLQIRAHMLKIPCATTKTRHSQVN